MTITQLEYIVAVDTYRSFVVAAEKCFITQPTLSMQVQKLEETLGTKIFDRSRQPVTPTDAGADIIAQARVLLAEGEKIKEIIGDRQRELSGELKIAVIPTIAAFIMPQILQKFTERHPQVKLIVSDLNAEDIVMQLKLGRIDCGILSTPLHDAALTELPLFYESFVAYVSKEGRLHKKKHLVPRDISADELWLINEGHCLREQILKICLRQKSIQTFKPLEYNTVNIETLQRLVDINGGAAIFPELAIGGLIEQNHDKLRYFKSPEPAREVSIVVQKNFLKRRMIEALKTEILDILPKRLKSRKKKEIIEI